jgi:uncharacterized membrane protein
MIANNFRISLTSISLLMAGMAPAAAAPAPRYDVVDLAVNSQGQLAINASGQAAGIVYPGNFVFITDANGANPRHIPMPADVEQVVVWGISDSGRVLVKVTIGGGRNPPKYLLSGPNGGEWTDLGALYGSDIVPTGLSSNGRVTGTKGNQAFLTGPDAGSLSIASAAAGSTGTIAPAINASGQIAGEAQMQRLAADPTISDANGANMRVLTDNWGGSFAITDQGYVTGVMHVGGNPNPHAFVTGANGTALLDLGVCPPVQKPKPITYDGSAGWGVNNEGVVVGQCQTDHGFTTATIRQGDGLVDLNSFVETPGWRIAVARAINDRGQIAAFGVLNGKAHAVLLQPK